ncbi:FCD domain-containing protein [Acerihabitans sp. TG2]|uniref:FadR/GntR family transcriptional regulator n=1 Tax=Acerihabitans sp. TG2 TaxID=3096008 RepID=UPI002B2382F5|nr:FCD domain-containing protein [Acerihabitans sp. TG2]MEA9391254.1 FCD domain-containing protein [Acerihabitans sp. TG2]
MSTTDKMTITGRVKSAGSSARAKHNSVAKHQRLDKTEAIISQLKQLIDEKGQMLPERVIAEKLNIKRHTLRQSLQKMRDRGELAPAQIGRRALRKPAVSPTAHAGGTPAGVSEPVVPPTTSVIGSDLVGSTNPLEVMEMRMLLEPALARLAALRASPEEIAQIQRAATTPDHLTPSMADQVFHKAVAAGSRNSLATELYVLLNQVATDSRLRFSESDQETSPERVAQRDAEHCQIATAIASRDPDTAERAMWEHLAVVQRKIMSRLGFAPVMKDFA